MSSADALVAVLDDRAGFYMVPSASIAKSRARLSGAHLSEALAGLVCLARAAYVQHGASRDEQQTCEATLDEFAGGILGVGRARALRILDNLARTDVVCKEAHRFDGMRRLPMKITFSDLPLSFAYVSGPAFRRLLALSERGGPPVGTLALYVSLVARAGEQRSDFPDGGRRIARVSQADLARLSGLSVSSVKRALRILKDAGLLIEDARQPNALKTMSVYRLVDAAEASAEPPSADGAADRPQPESQMAHSGTDDRSQPNSPMGHSRTDDGSQSNPRMVHSRTDDGSQPNSRIARSRTDDSSVGDSSPVHSATDGWSSEPSHAGACDVQISEDYREASPSGLPQGTGGDVLEVEVARLVAVFLAWTRHALGDRQARTLYDDAAWRAAALQLLERYDLDRVLAGVERLSRDPLLADRGTSLPAFAKIADRAIARAVADRGYERHRASQPPAAARAVGAGTSWAAAHELLAQAVSAFGRGGEEPALAFLQERDPGVARFARDVGWRTLARSDREMIDVKFAYIEFCRSDQTEAA